MHHSFADDLQLQMSALPDKISELLHTMQSCISDVKAWATANMLKLNDNKTELMFVTSKTTKHLHNLPTSITIGNARFQQFAGGLEDKSQTDVIFLDFDTAFDKVSHQGLLKKPITMVFVNIPLNGLKVFLTTAHSMW